jgi:hypothetical protein
MPQAIISKPVICRRELIVFDIDIKISSGSIDLNDAFRLKLK